MTRKESLTAETLEARLNSMLQQYEDVGHCRFVGVYWHEPDDEGCNWDCHLNCGNGIDGHASDVADAVLRLARSRYQLAE